MGVEGTLKSTPKVPTWDETEHYSLSWEGKSRGERGGGIAGAVGPWQRPPPNLISLFSFHRGHRQGSCDLNPQLPSLLPTLSCFNLPTSFGF